MKSNTALLLVAAVVVAYVLYTRYATFTNLQFVPKGISLVGSSFLLTLGVQNTSSQSVQYNSFAGTLTVNGSNVGTISDFQAVTIQPNAETDIQISVAPNILGVAAQIFNQVESGQVGINSATVQGNANIGGTQYPVNVSLT